MEFPEPVHKCDENRIVIFGHALPPKEHVWTFFPESILKDHQRGLRECAVCGYTQIVLK